MASMVKKSAPAAMTTKQAAAAAAKPMTTATTSEVMTTTTTTENRGSTASAKVASLKTKIARVTVETVTAEFVVLGGLDLFQVASRCINTEFKRNGCVEVRLKRPRILFRVHASGKVIAMGAASEAEAMTGCRRIARLMQKRLSSGSAMRFRKYKITNIMASYKAGAGLLLDKFYAHHKIQLSPVDLEYFSDLHNHVKLNLKNKFGVQAKLQLWASGNVKIHTPSLGDLTEAVRVLVPMLEQFKTDATSAFLARRSATRGLAPVPAAKMGEISSSSSSSDEESSSSAKDRDPAEVRARAAKRNKRDFVNKHLDRVWTKWAQFGKHAFIGDDDDDEDSGDLDGDDGDHDNGSSRKRRRSDRKEACSYAGLNSSDED